MLRAGAILLTLLLGLADIVRGQPDEDERQREPRPTGASIPSALSMHLTFTSAFDSNIEQNDRDLSSRGLLGGLVFRSQKGGRGKFFRVEYGVGAQTFTNTERFDSTRHELSASYSQRLGSTLTASAIARYSRRVATEDRELANQYNVWPQLEYRPIDWTRIGIYGGYRSTHVEEEDAGQERVRLIGTDIGFEIGDFSIAELRYRFEKSNSVETRRRYDRVTLRAEYALRATRRDTIGVRIERRQRIYPERLVRVGELRVPREEHRFRPSVYWVHRFGAGLRLEVGYEYQRRNSNDPRRNFERHRVDFNVRVSLARNYSTGSPGRGFPQPRLPDGSEVMNDNVLDQLRYLETKTRETSEHDVEMEEGRTFTEGSSWEDVLSAQGLPSRTSERPQFFEELWFYGSSWVVLKSGTVVSWHDAGELRAVTPDGSFVNEAPRPNGGAIPKPRATVPTLVEVANQNRRQQNETTRVNIQESLPSDGPRLSPSAALRQTGLWHIVLTDGRTLDGYVRKFEGGLAHVVLFLPNDKTLFATLPADLVDAQASQYIASNERR